MKKAIISLLVCISSYTRHFVFIYHLAQVWSYKYMSSRFIIYTLFHYMIGFIILSRSSPSAACNIHSAVCTRNLRFRIYSRTQRLVLQHTLSLPTFPLARAVPARLCGCVLPNAQPCSASSSSVGPKRVHTRRVRREGERGCLCI